MDLRFDTALRNASKAWAQNRTTDTITLQHLKLHAPTWQATSAMASSNVSVTPSQPSPQLARFGTLGTKLSVYA